MENWPIYLKNLTLDQVQLHIFAPPVQSFYFLATGCNFNEDQMQQFETHCLRKHLKSINTEKFLTIRNSTMSICNAHLLNMLHPEEITWVPGKSFDPQ